MHELAPQDLKLDVDQFTREEAVRSAHYLTHVVGRAHGRQMDEATRSGWRREVLRGTDGGEQAPNWLWSSSRVGTRSATSSTADVTPPRKPPEG